MPLRGAAKFTHRAHPCRRSIPPSTAHRHRSGCGASGSVPGPPSSPSSSRSIRLRRWTACFAASAVRSSRRWRPPIARRCLQARHASAIQHLRGLQQTARNKAVMSVANRRAWRTWRSIGRRPALQVQAHNSSVPLTLLVRRHCCPYARSQRIQDFETANSSQ